MSAYVPDAGDIVWLHFDPQAGHEQAGHRPAAVLSPKSYNGKTGWCSGTYLAPVTSTPPPSTNSKVDEAIARAKSGVGFSYHWGAGCWSPGGRWIPPRPRLSMRGCGSRGRTRAARTSRRSPWDRHAPPKRCGRPSRTAPTTPCGFRLRPGTR